MIRALFRLLAMLALAVAVVLAVLDATRTVAASKLVLTPLGASWQSGMPGMLESTQTFVEQKLHSVVWESFAATVLQAPGFAVFLVLAFLLYAIGRRPRQSAGRPAFQR